jgi:hypothetical protein
MSAISNIRLGGLGFVSTTEKKLDRSTTYDHLFPKPDWKQTIVRRNGKVTDVVADMKKVIYGYREQARLFAPYMRGKDIYETCRNIWTFWYNRCKYKEDTEGLEELRTISRSYWEGAGFKPGADEDNYGIDCDDFSIAVSQTLLNIGGGIPHYLRIARYPLKDYFQHVYVVVPYGGKNIIIDCVLDAFDQEKNPEEIKDFLIMDNYSFNGIDVAVLSGIGDAAPLLDVVTGSDFYSLSGLGETTDEQQELNALYQHIKKTRDLVAENPELVKEVEHPEQFLKMLDYAIKYWNTDKRDQALEILAANETNANQLRGFSPGSDTSESEIELRALSGGGYEVLGKAGGQRKFFNKVKEAAQKVGQGVKKVAVAAVKYNPLTIAARAGVLLALKTNLLHMGDHLKWGYLSEAEAKENGFDMGEWKKSYDAVQNTEKMFSNILQGDKNNLKHTILTGRAGNLASVNIGSLGIEPVITATTTAAATGFLAKIKSWIKNIDLKKMLKKVDLKKLTGKLQDKANDAAKAAENNEADPSVDQTPPPADDSNARKSNTNEPEPGDENGFMKVLPFIGLGVLALWAMSSSSKKKEKKSNGLGSTKGKGKKNPGYNAYDLEILSGVNHHESNYPSEAVYPYKPKTKKKKGASAKIKRITLR